MLDLKKSLERPGRIEPSVELEFPFNKFSLSLYNFFNFTVISSPFSGFPTLDYSSSGSIDVS